MSEIRKYRPSNGTEGMSFIGEWCGNCEHDKHEDCPIVAATFVYDVDDPKYPDEWRYNYAGNPICTEFVLLGKKAPVMKRNRDTQTAEMFPEPPKLPSTSIISASWRRRRVNYTVANACTATR